MARIQSKTAGRRIKAERINPAELRKAAEEALVRMGKPSIRWGSLKPNRKPKTADRHVDH